MGDFLKSTVKSTVKNNCVSPFGATRRQSKTHPKVDASFKSESSVGEDSGQGQRDRHENDPHQHPVYFAAWVETWVVYCET